MNDDYRNPHLILGRLRHAYDSINSRLIWLIVEKDLTPLKAAAQGALRKFMECRRQR
jgi:uncharacterized protein with HEPN domain